MFIGRVYLHRNLVHALCSHPVIYDDSLTDSPVSRLLNLCARHAAPPPAILISLEKRYIKSIFVLTTLDSLYVAS